MTNRVLWLLSYLGLSLALSLGNRQTSQTTGSAEGAGPSPIGEQQQQQRSVAYEPRHAAARGALHDWLVYDKRPDSAMLSADRLVLLDDVLSAVLGNFYRQQQQQQQQQRHQRQEEPRGVAAAQQRPLMSFLDEDEDEEEDEQLLDDEDLPRRMMLRSSSSSSSSSGRPFDSPSAYLEARSPPSAARRTSVNSLGYLEPAKPPPLQPSGPSKRNNQAATKEGQQQPQHPGQLAPAQAIAAAGASMASQFMLRSARGNRQYDVPQIECPLSDDGMERFACPTADRMGRYRCIDDHVLCDGFIDCPTGEDEDRQACMFYKTTKAHLDVLADALLRWARGR